MSLFHLVAYGLQDVYLTNCGPTYSEFDEKRIEKIQKWFKNRNKRKIIKYRGRGKIQPS